MFLLLHILRYTVYTYIYIHTYINYITGYFHHILLLPVVCLLPLFLVQATAKAIRELSEGQRERGQEGWGPGGGLGGDGSSAEQPQLPIYLRPFIGTPFHPVHNWIRGPPCGDF